MPVETLDSLTQFGVAGLMGVLWTWERWFSRRRERELSEAHRRLMSQREALDTLIGLVQRNTQAIERFDNTQQRLNELLEQIHNDRDSRRVA